MRKLKLFAVALVMISVTNFAQAQDDVEITQAGLRKYALLTEIVDGMKEEIRNQTASLVKNQEGIDGKRFNELNKAKGDEAKLEAAGATDFEKQFMALVKKKKDERTTAIQDVVKILASKLFTNGAKEYKAIKSSLKSDEEVKARYDAIVAKMKLEVSDA